MCVSAGMSSKSAVHMLLPTGPTTKRRSSENGCTLKQLGPGVCLCLCVYVRVCTYLYLGVEQKISVSSFITRTEIWRKSSSENMILWFRCKGMNGFNEGPYKNSNLSMSVCLCPSCLMTHHYPLTSSSGAHNGPFLSSKWKERLQLWCGCLLNCLPVAFSWFPTLCRRLTMLLPCRRHGSSQCVCDITMFPFF